MGAERATLDRDGVRWAAGARADACRARLPVAVMLHDLRAAAFAPPLLAAVSPRQSLLRSVRPGLLAARCVFESERTACCTGLLSRGRLLRLSAAASEVSASLRPFPATSLCAMLHVLLPSRCVAPHRILCYRCPLPSVSIPVLKRRHEAADCALACLLWGV